MVSDLAGPNDANQQGLERGTAHSPRQGPCWLVMITEWLRLIHQRLRRVSLIREERHEVGSDLLDQVRKDNAKNCSIKKQLQSTRLAVAFNS